MALYIIIIGLLFISLIFLKRAPFMQKYAVFVLLSIILIFFSAIRYDVGVDYFNYLRVFNGTLVVKEVGFRALVSIIQWIGLPYEFLIFLMAALTIPLATRFIIKNSKEPIFSLIIFFTIGQFYFNTFNSVRQCLVVYIFLNAISYIEGRSFKKYALTMLFAAFMFHATALILLPIYFIAHREYSLKFKAIIMGAAIAASKFAMIIIEHSPYAAYLRQERFTSSISPSSILLIGCSIFLLFFKSSDNKIRNNIFSNINVSALTTLLLLIVFSGTPLIMPVNRLSYYFTPIIIVMLPNVIKRLFKPNSQLIIECAISILLITICILALYMNGESNNTVPYRIIL